jgi:hypothetical protein
MLDYLISDFLFVHLQVVFVPVGYFRTRRPMIYDLITTCTDNYCHGVSTLSTCPSQPLYFAEVKCSVVHLKLPRAVALFLWP